MDLFDIAGRRDTDALERALAANPAAASSRNADGASILSFVHYIGWGDAVAPIRAALGQLTPHEAIIAGDDSALTAAIGRGWDGNELSSDGFPPLALAAFFGREALFDILLPLTTDLDARSANRQQVSALHAAAASRSNGMVEKLLRAGADPNLPQQDGFRPLHTAAQHGDAVLAGLLLLFGADPALTTAEGKRPRDLAAAAGHDWLARRL